MFTRLRLGTKFTLILFIVFIVGVIIGGVVLWQALQRNAQAEITVRGLILIETMNAVRTYTGNNIDPLLAEEMATSPEFISETAPAFSARAVFENFRRDEPYANFLYKEASSNPTNLLNKADDFEARILERLRRERELQELSGFRILFDERVFYIARPMVVNEESCLLCHSTPEAAPANLVAKYGSENGFGWQLGGVVAAQMIYVPAEEVFNAAMRSFLLVMAIFVVLLAITIWLINFLLSQYVIKPVGVLGEVAQKISADQVQAEDIEAASLASITRRADELGYLAAVFQRMAREVYARVQKLKEQVQSLKIEIDEIKQKQQVAEVVETDFFRDLQAKANQVRQRRQRSHGDVTAGSE
jgi:HAMP domain-containing protein